MKEFLKELSELMKKHNIGSISGCYGHGTWIESADQKEYFSTDKFTDNNILDRDGYDITEFNSDAIDRYLDQSN